MAAEPAARERNPWLPLFVLSIGALAGSLVALAIVLFDVISDGEMREPAGQVVEPGETPLPEVRSGLTYSGALPRGAEGLELRLAETGKTPDIEFVPGEGEGSVVTRYFVPVAALGAGVDSLTSDELRRLLKGELSDWELVGGISRGVRPVAPSAEDLRSYSEWLVGKNQASGYVSVSSMDGYEALRLEMTTASGIVAIVPIEELRPNMVAISIDGLDIARGVGDPAAWPLVERVQVIGKTAKGKDEAEAIRAHMQAKLPEVIRVLATGDVLQSRCSLAAIEATGDWGAALRGPVGEYLAGADLALSSLDGSIQGLGKPYGCIVMEFPT